MNDFLEYFNFRPAEKTPKEVFSYSQFLQTCDAEWTNFFMGKREGADIYYGHFKIDRDFFTFLAIKAEVKPAIVTDMPKEDFNYEHQINIGNLKIFAKEKYMLENIKKSDEFLLCTQGLFRGENNLLEFTDLNQVIIITDHIFKDSQEMNDFFAKFKQLKDKI